MLHRDALGRPAVCGQGARTARNSLARGACRAAARQPYPPVDREINSEAPTDVIYDAVIVGGGMGGLTTAAKLAARGAKVVVLEKYLVPGGSAAAYKREGYTFDVGSSMMFGFGDGGTTNLITKALEAVGKRMATVPDPTQVHYHLPASKAHPEVRMAPGECARACGRSSSAPQRRRAAVAWLHGMRSGGGGMRSMT